MASTEWQKKSEETILMLTVDFRHQEDISEVSTMSQEIQTRGTITVSSTQGGIHMLGNVAQCCNVLL
jgi:hypothetical protein